MSAYEGLKVLDCSQGRVGPMAAMLFADFGAEVLKVEPPGGDRAKASPGYQMWNRGKRTLTLDIASGGERLEPLLAAADLAIFDQSPGQMRALGLMDAAERHPRLVRLWTPPYGTTGAWSELEAHHGMLQALSGAAYRQSAYADQPVYLVMPVLHYQQASLAAAAAGAALFQRSKTGLGQAVTVSGLNAVAMVGGSSGVVAPAMRQPLGASPSYRLYECGDGKFLFLATLFRYFFDRAVQAMGVEGIELIDGAFADSVPALMEARFRERPRDEWLEILHAADVPAAPVGTRETWLASEIIANNQMRLVLDDPERGAIDMPGAPVKLAATPAAVRGLVRAADKAAIDSFASAPQPPARAAAASAGSGPLAGIRVLDLGTVIAGAYANGILANLGAEVVKVEGTDGDPWRAYELGFAAYNRGKRGLVVDLKRAEGRDVFLDLAATADVVLDNYRAGTRERLGIGHAAVRAVNPRAISCSVTTYGAKGAETKRPGFDPLLQALSGMMAAQGGDQGEPVFHTIAVNDFASAAMAAFGVITALNARERTGAGQAMETSLAAQSAIFQGGELTTWPGAPSAPKGGRDCLGVAALDRFYACADGWILIACRDADEARHLAAALGEHGWDSTYDMMAEGRDGPLAGALAQKVAELPLATVIETLVSAGVRAAPVVARGMAAVDPWLAENAFMDTLAETADGAVRNTCFATFSRARTGYSRPEPGLGEHSFEVLADWGIEAERIAGLGEQGVIMRLC